MTTASERREGACNDARQLAHKIAPLLKELEGKLEAEGVDPDTRTASYILLQAAAGFVRSQEGRGALLDFLDDLATAERGDLLEPQIY